MVQRRTRESFGNTYYCGLVSRGLGSCQKRVLAALIQKAGNDVFARPESPTGLFHEVASDIGEDTPHVVTAYYRWYTIDLLGLVPRHGPRSQRVAMHRAIRSLAFMEHSLPVYLDSDEIEIDDRFPYPQILPFSNTPDYLDLRELATVDPRWPSGSGRCLWFRIRPPMDEDDYTGADQYALLWRLEIAERFGEFLSASDKVGRWKEPDGKFLRWLFCGARDR